MATLSDLTAKATVGETLKADAVAMGVGDVTEGLPAWAGEGQTRAFAVSSSEFDAFYKNYVDLQNTGVKALGGATVENGASAEDVTAAVSGTQATMTYNDGSTKTFNVDWNADDLAAVDTSKAGTYEVKALFSRPPRPCTTTLAPIRTSSTTKTMATTTSPVPPMR